MRIISAELFSLQGNNCPRAARNRWQRINQESCVLAHTCSGLRLCLICSSEDEACRWALQPASNISRDTSAEPLFPCCQALLPWTADREDWPSLLQTVAKVPVSQTEPEGSKQARTTNWFPGPNKARPGVPVCRLSVLRPAETIVQGSRLSSHMRICCSSENGRRYRTLRSHTNRIDEVITDAY
jgi:hypothetical protein